MTWPGSTVLTLQQQCWRGGVSGRKRVRGQQQQQQQHLLRMRTVPPAPVVLLDDDISSRSVAEGNLWHSLRPGDAGKVHTRDHASLMSKS